MTDFTILTISIFTMLCVIAAGFYLFITNKSIIEFYQEKISLNYRHNHILWDSIHAMSWNYEPKKKCIHINNDHARLNLPLHSNKRNITLIELLQLMPKTDQDKVLSSITSLVNNKNDKVYSLEHRIRTKSGNYIWVITHLAIGQYDKLRHPSSIIAATISINERKIEETALRKLNNEVKSVGNMKNAFLTNINHEVRTPLNLILGFSELMTAEDSTLDERKQYAEIISSSTQSLLNLFESALNISQLLSGNLVVNLTQFSVNDFLAEMYTYTQNTYLNKSIELQVKFLDEDIKIVSDFNCLLMAIKQLVDNAYKFTTGGEIEIGSKANKKNKEY